MEQNPTLLQLASPSQQHAAPLILIHDGGGTTFSYHCLPLLDRAIWAIHNPRFYSGRKWSGGIPEMAKVYLELIRSVLPSGPLILGGESRWSLGGLIALETATLLSMTPEFSLLGLVMIDSICPTALQRQMSKHIIPHGLFRPSIYRPELNFIIANQLKASAKMVEEWKLPCWPPSPLPFPKFHGRSRSRIHIPALETSTDTYASPDSTSPSSSTSPRSSPPSRTQSSSTTTGSTFSYSSSSSSINTPPTPKISIPNERSENGSNPTTPHPKSPPPPPTVLLRCNSYVPVSKPHHPDAISRVDVARDDALLGWDEHDARLIRYVMDIPGHHFNLFAEENIGEVGMRIMDACEFLERMDERDRYESGDVGVF